MSVEEYHRQRAHIDREWERFKAEFAVDPHKDIRGLVHRQHKYKEQIEALQQAYKQEQAE